MSKSPSKSSCKYKKRISVDKSDTIGDFKIGAKIGQCTFIKVCQGIHIPTGEKVAIKILPKNQIKEKSDKIRIEKEISLQKKLHHQNIIQQYSVLDTESSIYIITEYCSGGELFDYIVSKRRLQEIEACRIFQQLINGLEYLHKQKICHRDLKPENLLFDSKHNLKIADFGLSNDYIYGKLTTPCGSPCYAAPEMVTGKKYYGDTVDIWSSGIVLYSMVCGYLPFEDDNQSVLFHKIAKGLFSLPTFLSNSCKDLIKNILITNPNKRYGFEDIKKHPWFMSVNSIGGKNIFFISPGILIDYDVIPIDINIIKEIYYNKEYKNFSILNIVNDVIRDKHNKLTTAYYLILKRKLKNNEESVSNISSNSKLFIEYMKKPISKMDYWDNNYDKIIDYYCGKVKELINKEKTKKKLFKKNKNNLEIFTDTDILHMNGYSNDLIEEEKQNKLIETNYMNEDLKLSTIVYDDDEEKNLFKIKNRKKITKKKKYNSYQKENEDDYLEYKMNNYELDSDESLIKKIYGSSHTKKHFSEFVKTNENILEENENISLVEEANEIIFNKIIQNADNSIEINNNVNKDKGRNKKSNEEVQKNNSVCTVKNNKIKDLIFTEKKPFNDEKNILITEVYKNNNIKVLNNKNNKIEKNNKYVMNAINTKNNNNIEKKGKKRKKNLKKFTLPNNSYFYRKIASMMDKDEKVSKFINKKKLNNKSQKEQEDKNKKNFYYNKINEQYKYNKIKEAHKYKNNNSFDNTPSKNNSNIQRDISLPKYKGELSPNIQITNNYNKINNNINVKNINNYNIGIYKYKINLINNNNLNLQEFYKKLYNMDKYNKYITKKNIHNKNNNITKKKKYYNHSINTNQNRNEIINKFLVTENNHKKYKSSCQNNIYFNYYNNVNTKKNKIKPILFSEIIPKQKRRIISGLSQEPIKMKVYHNKSEDRNILKISKKIKKYSYPKFKNNYSHSIDNKSKDMLNRRHIYNFHSDINSNTYCSNGSISMIKEKTPQKKLTGDISVNKTYLNNYNITNKNKSGNNIKNYIYNANIYGKAIYNNKNIIYHKKFINLNKRYNNSVETHARKKKYILQPYNNNFYNNSLISLITNKNKKSNFFQKMENKKYLNSNNNNSNTLKNQYNKSSIKNMKSLLIKRNHFFSQEKPKNSLKLNSSPFGMPMKSKIMTNKNKNVFTNIHYNKSTNNKNINFAKNYNVHKIIEKINKIPTLACCKCSLDKIKEVTEKIFLKNDKSNSTINVAYSLSCVIIKCKLVNKSVNLSFELHISKFNDAKNYVLIKPNLLKGEYSLLLYIFFLRRKEV